jgi:hypothetical protein
MKKAALSILLGLCTSCATIMNKRHQTITVISNTPVNAIIGRDTFEGRKNKVKLTIPRSSNALTVTVFNGAASRKIVVHPGNSMAYWFNIYATWGIGTFVDDTMAKRYAYPKRFTAMLSKGAGDTAVFLPDDSRISPFENNFKISPLRLLFSHPGIEFSYERYICKRFSAQIGWARLYDIDFESSSGEGYQVHLEGKYFDVRRIRRLAPYASLEIGYYEINFGSDFYHDRKKMQYLIPKFGIQHSLGARWLFDAYAGLGIKHQMGDDETTFGIVQLPSRDFYDLKIALNFKLGYRF